MISGSAKRLVYVLILALLPFMVHWHLIAPNPADRWVLGVDSMDSAYGVYKFTADALLSGELPQWNHYSFLGHPAFADFEYTPFYPMIWLLTAISAITGFDIAFAIFALLHLSILGIGVFKLAEEMTGHIEAAFLAGILSIVSFQSSFTLFFAFQILGAVIWLPLIFLNLMRYREKMELRHLIYASALMGVTCLSGIIVMIPYVFLFLLIFIAVEYWSEGILKAASVLVFVSLSGLLLGLPSILPTATFILHSARVNTGGWYFSVANQGIHTEVILSTMVFQAMNPFVQGGATWTRIYFGILGHFFFVVSALRVFIEKDLRLRAIWICTIFTVLYSLGHIFVFNDILYWILPVFDKMHAHFRILAFLVVFVPIIVAYGYMRFVERIEDYGKVSTYFFVFAFISALVPIGLIPIERPISGGGYSVFNRTDAIIWFMLIYLTGAIVVKQTVIKRITKTAFHLFVIIFLVFELMTVDRMTGLSVKYDLPSPLTYNRNPLKTKAGINEYLIASDYNHSNMNMSDRVSSWSGFLTAGLKRYFYLLASTGHVINSDRMESVKEFYKNYSNPYIDKLLASPRISLANRYVLKKGDDKELLEYLMNNNGYAAPLIESDSILQNMSGQCKSDEVHIIDGTVVNCIGKVGVGKLDSNGIEMDVNSSEDALLVWYDNYYPGWKASVDGTVAEIYKTNYTFKSVFVPKGNHKVSFRFRDKYMMPSAFASFVAWCILGLACWKYRRPASLPFQKPK